jgi:hypothetical protein
MAAMAVTLMLALGAAPLRAAPPDTAGASADVDWVLARIARPAPARTAFVELRGSSLLKAPLRIAGEYRRLEDDTLVREVRSPYPETTTIAQGQVRIERAGKTPRSFPLSRAPELAGLQASFGALLAGDRARLERHYVITTDGTRQHWTLKLVPRDAALAERLADVTLHGRGAELRCIESRPVDGAAQRTLLAGAARDAGDIDGDAALRALCHGTAAKAE